MPNLKEVLQKKYLKPAKKLRMGSKALKKIVPNSQSAMHWAKRVSCPVGLKANWEQPVKGIRG